MNKKIKWLKIIKILLKINKYFCLRIFLDESV